MFGKKQQQPVMIQPPQGVYQDQNYPADFPNSPQMGFNQQNQVPMQPVQQPQIQPQRRREALVVKCEMGTDEGSFVTTIISNYPLIAGANCEVNQ